MEIDHKKMIGSLVQTTALSPQVPLVVVSMDSFRSLLSYDQFLLMRLNQVVTSRAHTPNGLFTLNHLYLVTLFNTDDVYTKRLEGLFTRNVTVTVTIEFNNVSINEHFDG